MAFNKYTQITPAKYDARSLQETLYLPTLKRKQHDRLEDQAAVTKSQLDKFDALDEYSGMAQEEKERLTNQMDSFSEQLAKQGVNSSSKSKFLDIAGDYSKSTSESGKLYKIDAIRKKYLADKERILADANSRKYDPEQNLANLDKAYKAHFENNDPEDLKFINLPNSPEFYGVAEAVNQFRDTVGQTTFNEIINAGSYKVDENGIIQIDKSSVTTASNLSQLEDFRDLLNQNLTAEGSKGKATADWQGRSTEDITKEINSVINTMKNVKNIEEKQKTFNFSWGNSRKSSDVNNNDGILDTVHSTDKQNTLGLESYKELNNQISVLEEQYRKAKEIPNNEKVQQELKYKIREAEEVKLKLDKSASRYVEQEAEEINGMFESLNRFLPNATPEQKELLTTHVDKLISGNPDIMLEGQTKVTIEENDDDTYTVSAIPYKNEESAKIQNIYGGSTSINRAVKQKPTTITIPKYLGDKIKQTKERTDIILKNKQEFLDEQASTYKFDRKVETPIYKNNADKNNIISTSLSLLGKSNAISAEDITIRDPGGTAIESGLGNEKISEAVTNYISTNAYKIANNAQMRLGQIGNRNGFVIDIVVPDEIKLAEEFDIEKGGTMEVFIPLNEETVNDPNIAQGYFFNKFDSETKSTIRRNIKYANINTTINKNDLGKQHNYTGAKISKDPSHNFNIDFLKEIEKDDDGYIQEKITIQKLEKDIENPNAPAKIIGSMKWGELFTNSESSDLKEYFKNIENTKTKEDFVDMLKNRLISKEEKDAYKNSQNRAEFLHDKFKDEIIILNSKNEINILLSITDN